MQIQKIEQIGLFPILDNSQYERKINFEKEIWPLNSAFRTIETVLYLTLVDEKATRRLKLL